jgi:hypothetical protein
MKMAVNRKSRLEAAPTGSPENFRGCPTQAQRALTGSMAGLEAQNTLKRQDNSAGNPALYHVDMQMVTPQHGVFGVAIGVAIQALSWGCARRIFGEIPTQAQRE